MKEKHPFIDFNVFISILSLSFRTCSAPPWSPCRRFWRTLTWKSRTSMRLCWSAAPLASRRSSSWWRSYLTGKSRPEESTLTRLWRTELLCRLESCLERRRPVSLMRNTRPHDDKNNTSWLALRKWLILNWQ